MAGRNLGVGMDFSPSSEYALKWGLANLAMEGDNVFVIVVNTRYAEDRGDAVLWKDNGAPLIPLEELAEANIRGLYGMKWKGGVIEEMKRAAIRKRLKIGVKVYWGDPRDKLCAAAAHIPLHLLIVGSKGLGTLKRVFVGSVSDHVVSNAVCPVTVVKMPEKCRT